MKVLHVYSGGLDSSVLLAHLIANGHEVAAVNFNYGSKHNARERRAAIAVAKHYGINLQLVDLDFNALGFKSSLLTSGEAIPEGHYAEENMKSTVVPFRNGIMLSIAIGLAESQEMQGVSLGAHGGDHTIYPDCRPDFFSAMTLASKYGTWAGIDVLMPFVNLDKTRLVEIGDDLQVPLDLTYSCYNGGENHCGSCGACNERKEAFALNGITDPTIYGGSDAVNQ